MNLQFARTIALASAVRDIMAGSSEERHEYIPTCWVIIACSIREAVKRFRLVCIAARHREEISMGLAF
jgi:hypothetical protein